MVAYTQLPNGKIMSYEGDIPSWVNNDPDWFNNGEYRSRGRAQCLSDPLGDVRGPWLPAAESTITFCANCRKLQA